MDIFIDVSEINPSPYQPRIHIDPARLKDLGENIRKYGLIHPIKVRPIGNRFELLAGERRMLACSDIGIKQIRTEIIEANDTQARGIVLSENIARDDLSPIEKIRAYALWIDHEMAQANPEYAEIQKQPLQRITWVLMKFDNERRRDGDSVSNKFIGQIETVFRGLPEPTQWQSFYINDLKPYVGMDEEVKEVAATKKLNKSQTKAVQKLKEINPKSFQTIKEDGKIDLASGETVNIEDASSREIEHAVSMRPVSYHVSDDSYEWFTPLEYIEAARVVMNGIDLDPATSIKAQTQIKAATFYTRKDDGLSKPWFGKVWLNPPYNMPLIEQFIDRAISEYKAGNITCAIVLTNNSTDTEWFHKLIQYPFCLTRGRIQFWNDDQTLATRQGQALFYLGNNPDLFVSTFSAFGAVLKIYDY